MTPGNLQTRQLYFFMTQSYLGGIGPGRAGAWRRLLGFNLRSGHPCCGDASQLSQEKTKSPHTVSESTGCVLKILLHKISLQVQRSIYERRKQTVHI